MTGIKKVNVGGNVEGILRGLGDLVERLGALAEKSEELKQSGVFDINTGGKDAKAVYGFSVKMGLGGDETKIEPFGNVRRNEQTGETVVHEVSEPLVDVLDENDHVLVLVELPGGGDEDLTLDLVGDILTLHAERGSKKYHKEIVLPREFKTEQMERTCRNGICEIKLKD